MTNNDDQAFEEPPPSYEEATGRPSITHRPQDHPEVPPPLPLRNASSAAAASTKPGASAAAAAAPAATTLSPTAPAAPRPGPAQSFSQLPTSAQQTRINRQFPPLLNLYRDPFPGALQRRYFIGEHQNTPLYAVGAWSGWPVVQSSLVLHNGPTEDYAALATVSYDSWGRRMDVTLPPLRGTTSSDPIAVLAPGMMTAAFRFRVEIPWPDENGGITWRREAYEWRRSNSLAVAGLAGSTTGWKLVRLTNDLPPGGVTVAGSGPPSRDGHEVVAVCTNAVMSMTKLWKFCFLGTGVSGALGERWAVMAVTTGLAIWDREHRRH
ncbi:hypothetical protein BD289DRAFT_378124 [Coniella lustricola]|uniref:Uncharacterized protein n=1 Tax=Coniella lustricola TaxID=2025994 RepID=A0A2T2ZUJ8_9PEZI|nr:hypothetical protein BD289DRAFT_378124 [Coniella lustricola]